MLGSLFLEAVQKLNLGSSVPAHGSVVALCIGSPITEDGIQAQDIKGIRPFQPI